MPGRLSLIGGVSGVAMAAATACTLLAPSDDDFLDGEREGGAGAPIDGHRGPDSTTPADAVGVTDAARDRASDVIVPIDAQPPPPCSGGCAATEVCQSTDAGSDCVAPAAALDGQRWDLRCGENYGSNSCRLYPPGTSSCPENGYYPIYRSLTFGGQSGTVYDLTLRFRGVVEPKTYTGGTPAGDNFYIGGTPSPSNFNVYGFTVSAPLPAVEYYLNFEPVRGERDYILTFDYQKTIPVEGGATITLIAYTLQCGLLRNCRSFATTACEPLVVDSLMPPAEPNGHVIQVDVISVAERD